MIQKRKLRNIVSSRNVNRRLYESIMRDVAKTVKRHLNEDNEYDSFDKKSLKIKIKTNLKNQQFNNTQPFAIHYKDEMEKDNILNFINDTIMEDTEVIDMSDYTNVKDFMYLIKDFADNDDVLLIFDLNTEIPGPIFNMLFNVLNDKMLGDTIDVQFKTLCLIDDTVSFNQLKLASAGRLIHCNLID